MLLVLDVVGTLYTVVALYRVVDPPYRLVDAKGGAHRYQT